MLFSAVRIKRKIHVSNTHQNRTFCQLHCKSREIKTYNLLHVVQCFGVHVCSVLYVVWEDHPGHSQKKLDDMCRENCASKGLFI